MPGIVPTPRSSVTNAARWVTWPETVPKNLTTEYHLKPSMKIDASSEFQDVQNEKEIISVMGGIEKKEPGGHQKQNPERRKDKIIMYRFMRKRERERVLLGRAAAFETRSVHV